MRVCDGIVIIQDYVTLLSRSVLVLQTSYSKAIEVLECRHWYLTSAPSQNPTEKITIQLHKDDHGVWMGTKEDLAQFAVRITEEQERGEMQEITLDLEVHSHRTFAGFICMIQLGIHSPHNTTTDSTQQQSMTSLRPILASPHILKIMHGAKSDTPWLSNVMSDGTSSIYLIQDMPPAH